MSGRLILALTAAWVAQVTGNCASPPLLHHGSTDDNTTLTDFNVGTSVAYKCDHGYTFKPGSTTTSTCQANNQWTPLNATCEHVCSFPPTLKHGSANFDRISEFEFSLGTTVTYKCNPGFTFTQGSIPTSICGVGAQWTPLVADCERLCPFPPTLKNGSANIGRIAEFEFNVGTVVSYKCNTGYKFTTTSVTVSTCTPFARWTPLTATCKSHCASSPPTFVHGSRIAGKADVYFVGTTVRIICDQSYRLTNGSQPLTTCQEDRSWTAINGTCEYVACRTHPPILEKGSLIIPLNPPYEIEMGTHVSYKCDPGYIFDPKVSALKSSCKLDLTWTPLFSTCKPVCLSSPPTLTHGSRIVDNITDFLVGTIVRYVCSPGNMLRNGSQPTSTCGEDKSWTTLNAICEFEACRTPPPTLENGSPIVPTPESPWEVAKGTQILYTCDSGYFFHPRIASLNSTCMNDLTWSPLNAACEPKDCGNPGEILNGYFEVPDSTLNRRATYYCHVGYLIVGDAHRVCTNNGWDGVAPSCEIATCPDLPLLSNGRTPVPPHTKEWQYEMVAMYSCIGEYSLVGSATVVCTAKGLWNKGPPTCTGVHLLQCLEMAE
ncbi:sushi, von Willebrand factor type A, EGF and pentraxin domain-containing protein 1-like isoform X2 [Scyliorhinus canicula]|uniref:sushi, von Willebrand factor type A, EGF and pentraxin domain-containing protein 1-like isoform X2 n=1 Tax=Scyliorhinus canicula TaxID=7830 RepID=UPI0018F47C2C|nr:sushi, von Willebrand factor type A, EGF and pentraxin domain-containing protein 1-like isoform X2 [Scyliorhinus canicula]